ncbi:MAG: hypothetical protein Ta2B_10480 [Termitinemataceae bacterium]|nr:MAG: hypothetical protein Ta2B_10480 [Termitinemataceae bacterium]
MKRVTHIRNGNISSPSQVMASKLPTPDLTDRQDIASSSTFVCPADGFIWGFATNLAPGSSNIGTLTIAGKDYTINRCNNETGNIGTDLIPVNMNDIVTTTNRTAAQFYPVKASCYTNLVGITPTQMFNKVGVFTPNAAGAGLSMEFIQSGSIVSVRINGTKSNASTGAIGTLSNLVINKNVQFTAFNGDGNVVRIEMSGTTISMYGTILAGTWVVGSTSFNNNDEAGIQKLAKYNPYIIGAPDLANPQTVISGGSRSSTWTATGNGYVQCTAAFSDADKGCSVNIAAVTVSNIQSAEVASTSSRRSDLIQILKGQVVTFGGTNAVTITLTFYPELTA